MANVKAAVLIALFGFAAATLFIDYFMIEPTESFKPSSIITQVGIVAIIVAGTIVGIGIALKKKKKS
jgi:K+-sensing histidine kinase KdpD